MNIERINSDRKQRFYYSYREHALWVSTDGCSADIDTNQARFEL